MLLLHSSVCFPGAGKCLRQTAPPLSRASRDKRYNTLDFLRKSCAKGGASPLGFPLHFLGTCQYKPQTRLVLTGLENAKRTALFAGLSV